MDRGAWWATWGHKESDMTERTHTHTHTHGILVLLVVDQTHISYIGRQNFYHWTIRISPTSCLFYASMRKSSLEAATQAIQANLRFKRSSKL